MDAGRVGITFYARSAWRRIAAAFSSIFRVGVRDWKERRKKKGRE